METAELFARLESREPLIVEEVKQTFHTLFNKTKDSWLLNGFFDYYLQTNSSRVIDVIVGVREPHDSFLFDRLADSLKGPNKLQGLTLLGCIVRKQPVWLYRIAQHSLLKELLKLLRNETEIVPMMSGLLVLIILLPIIPGYVKPVLPDIFDILCRLASWKSNQAKLSDEHLNHLQIGLYFLFQRLYGMFPCSTFNFLKHTYSKKDNLGIFKHTIKPMLETVRFHTLLVTANPDIETNHERWMNKGHHDVIMECAEFALERLHGPVNRDLEGKATPRQRPMLDPQSFVLDERPYVTPLSALSHQAELWSPSLSCGLETPPPNKLSLPHTPLTHNQSYTSIGYNQEGSSPPEAGVEATPENTPVKDMRAVPPKLAVPGSTAVRALNLLSNKPNTSRSTSPNRSTPASPLRKETSPFHFAVEEKVTSTIFQRILSERQTSSEGPKKNGIAGLNASLELKDQPLMPRTAPVMVENSSHESHYMRAMNESAEYEECQYEQGSPCTSAGLHMPNSQSLINFTRKVRTHARLRYNSVCSPYPVLSAGASPSDGPSLFLNPKMRRISSCPNMKRLAEKDEHKNRVQDNNVIAVNGNGKVGNLMPVKECLSLGTQTSLDQWPNQPYEHLIPAVYPFNQQDVEDKSQGFCPYDLLEECISIAMQDHSLSHNLKQDLKKDVKTSEVDNEIKSLRLQLKLMFLQLQFERYRREVHAERNRRLAGKSRSVKALDEHNAALKEQINLLQKDIDRLQTELDSKRKKMALIDDEHVENTAFWQQKFAGLDMQNQSLQLANKNLQQQLARQNVHIADINKDVEKAQSTIFYLNSELKNLQESASTSERLSGELTQLQRQTVLMGEMFLKHKEQLDKMPLFAQKEEEVIRLDESSKREVTDAKVMLEKSNSNLEALKARALELESTIARKDNIISEQKRLLKATKEEAASSQEALENKYHMLSNINQKYEEEILLLSDRVALQEAQLAKYEEKLKIDKLGKQSPLADALSRSSSSATTASITTATTDITDLHSLVDARPSGHPAASPASPLLRATRPDLAATNMSANQRN